MDLDKIQELLKLMKSHGLEEIEIEDNDYRVRLKKESQGVAVTAPQVVAAPAAGAPPAQAAGAAPPADEFAESPDHFFITSPIVGSFYRSPSPDAEPFVEIGDPIDADKVVCIVEAMKVMNEVKAESPGVIEKIFIENGKPVEYGQPLFRVARS